MAGRSEQDQAAMTVKLRYDATVESDVSIPVGNIETDWYLSRPVDDKPLPGMILLSGMHGLSATQRDITRYYARAGFVAMSPNYMGGDVPKDHAKALHLKNALDINFVVNQLLEGAAYLRQTPWVGPEDKVGIMGFCLGGGLALLAAARSGVFQAGVIYHQSLFPDVRDLAGIDCKLQCHYGTDDHSTPQEEVDAFTKALDKLGKNYEVHMYEGMGHSFAQVSPDAELDAPRRRCADASYQRSFSFLHQQLSR